MSLSYYTPEGFKKLKEELEHLRSVERPRVSGQIAEARDKGDLSENAEYDAAKEAQGMGFGAAAFALALDYLLKQGGIRKVTGGTMAINHGFLRVMQKSGMVEDGVRKRHLLYQGQEIDCIMYAKFASDF